MKELTSEEMNGLWGMIGNVARVALLVPLDDLAALQDANEKAHAIGPFIDPTRYMQDMDRGMNNSELLRVFAKFRRDLDPIYKREMERIGR